MSSQCVELNSKTGIYTAICIPNLKEKVELYINAIDGGNERDQVHFHFPRLLAVCDSLCAFPYCCC